MPDIWLRWVAAVMLTVAQLLTVSCKSPDPVAPIGEEVPAEPPLLALEAYRGYDQYFLRYLRDGEVFYTLGDLKGRTPPAIGRDTADYGTPTVAPMRHDAPEDWVELTRNLTPVPILGIEQWSEFRDSLFGEFLPRERNTGVAVSFDRADYFFFYDQLGRFRARRLIDGLGALGFEHIGGYRPAPYSIGITRHVGLDRHAQLLHIRGEDRFGNRGQNDLPGTGHVQNDPWGKSSYR